ncbi:hypothetical protein V495_03683 [Pseudogymnoascus sp. VKM F-4514 (FW-929)]|nr:hypothetical protein V495_03683 [Pseudogymnoascus sp. VKM F-4514 (FW-929)]KFY54990.1 hypothetical protein V497_07300 [Pseudogymnoascus sp. VKM F-4516 (FW-969)]
MASKAEFGAQTEAIEVIEAFQEAVRDKTILITGVSPNGLGATIAHELAAQAPALLILTGRNSAKVKAIIAELATEFPSVKTRALIFDISSFESINAAAAQVLTDPEPCIDILINNAGVMNIQTRTLSTDGFEMQLAVNYLGAFLFTNSIMPKLLASMAARIANIVSNGHALSPFRFNDYNFENPHSLSEDQKPSKQSCEAFGVPWGLDYDPAIAYGQSKTAMILYTRELAVKLRGTNVTVACCNPGATKTELWRQMPVEVRESIFKVFPMKSLSQGAATPLITALDPKLPSGVYLDDSQVQDVAEHASDAEKAHSLWTLSEKWTGRTFDW